MYPTYVFRGGPCAGRHAARRAPQHARGLSGGFFPPAVFSGGRHHPFFGPPAHRGRGDVFDHFDDFVNRSFEGLFPAVAKNRANGKASVWQPRFDVREVDDAYQLRGELPGVDAKDLSVEFSDANTLVIRGQTQSELTEGGKPAQANAEVNQDGDAAITNSEKTPATADAHDADQNDAASVHSDSSYVQPTVEDEAVAERRESVGAPTESAVGGPAAATPTTDNAVSQQPQQKQQSRYWISERSTGSFSRVFEFPGRVDADNVTATLKDGILDVTVPKAKAPEARKIAVN